MGHQTMDDLKETVADYLKAYRKKIGRSTLTPAQSAEAIAEVLPLLMTEAQPTNADVIQVYTALIDEVGGAKDEISHAVDSARIAVNDYVDKRQGELEKVLSYADKMERELSELMDKVAKIKRQPNGTEAASLSPESWHCDVCGCKMRRVALDGVHWTKGNPRFCPGCGAPVAGTGKTGWRVL